MPKPDKAVLPPTTKQPTNHDRSAPAAPVRANRGLGGVARGELAKEIAAAHAERERQQAGAGERPRTKRLSSASAKSRVEAAYLDMWRQKIERIGRANYPPGGLSGELSLLAAVSYDGTLEEVRILESSGHPALDDAAVRIVRLAAPYSHFPTEMRKAYDRLEIVRRWRFARDGGFLH